MLVVGLLALGVLATPIAANGDSGPSGTERALVPAGLLAEATANPDQVFQVIVQGRVRSRTPDVETDVEAERAADPGEGKGIHNRFRTISGVAAELTGKQIAKLAARNDILTITRDAPVALGGGMLPPSVLVQPTIDGNAQVGQLLTASDGVWSGSDPIEYIRSWQRCDAPGSVCVDIEGSTGAVYTVGPADVGSTLRFTVRATNAVGSETGVSQPTSVVVTASVGPLPPLNLALPTISGTAAEGHTLSASEGTWGGSFPVAYTHAWQRCDATGAGCVGAADATGTSYVLTAIDIGHTLRVTVTASDAGGSTSASSLPSAVVQASALPPVASPGGTSSPTGVIETAPSPPLLQSPPAVSGEARDGASLTATSGVWTGDGTISQSYAWERCGVDYGQTVLADHPAGYWRFDDGSAADASGNGLNGLASGAVGPVDGASAGSSAVAFGANGGIDVPNANLGPAFTLETWVRVTQPQQDKALLGRWRYADGGGALLWIDTDGHYALAIGPQPATYLTTPVAPQPGRWDHVVGTWNGSTLTVFVNGAEAGSKPFVGNPGSTVRDFEIGKYGDPTQYLAGAVDESALYAHALSAADVRRHYEAGCHAIAGATGGSYTAAAADVGSRLLVRVTASNLTGSTTSISNATAQVAATPPASVSAPQVSGSAVVAQTLSASPGTWSGTQPITYSYRWQRCNSAGTCADVLGALGATYMLDAADLGATLKVVVTATNGAGSSEAASEPSAHVSGTAPVATTVAPSVTGDAVEGQTLTASSGTWTGTEPIAYTYRWRRCDNAGACADIAGATGSTYTLTAADVGATVKVVVSAANSVGSSAAESAPTARVLAAAPVVVAGALPVSVTPPSLSGVAEDGGTLFAATGTWSGATSTPAVRWERCDASGASCAAIAGAVGTQYLLNEADVGATVRAVVTATNSAGSASAPSAPSLAVVDTFTALQQWPAVVDAQASWASAKANVAAPTIAIVDSGIDADLKNFGGRVVHEETLTTMTPNSPGDGRGHGTLVASIAAGEAPGYAGVAPNAKIVSIDVLDDLGRARTSDVIAAADWIYRNKDTYGIRVANFSLHATTPTSFRFDPLNKAVQKLWFNGVVVVAAAGNFAVDGAKSGVPFPPGNDPFIITVGATDTAGTITAADDFTAPWSAWGFTPDGFAKPDVSAPGRYMVGAVPPTSTLVTERSENIVSTGYMQLSGTSFSAPVVSGAAAYLLAAHPTWTPDQVKGALMQRSVTLPSSAKNSYGIGEINIGAAAAIDSPPNPNLALNAFRMPDPTDPAQLVFDEPHWTSVAQTDEAWGAEAWGAEAWGAEAWGAEAWGAEAWGASYWEPVPSWTAPITNSAVDGAGTAATNNASGERLPAGGYWVTPP